MSGLAMTTAAGALIGYKFGGPIGAAIGAGAGAIAGIVRLFVKGAQEKAIEKVKAAYGLKIDQSIARQIVETARQSYGGNLDVAIRSQPVRELLKLYAMATGQGFGVQVRARPVDLVQSAGQLCHYCLRLFGC